MVKEFSFDHLSETEFEEFCFDLLKELGFRNIDWRKGTGGESSPSDSGRDIECERFVKDVDGKINKEKWFIECKHYKKGLPPEKIQGALSWANAERPDKLVIVVSNFLSNPCKNYLEKYINKNKPSFKIKHWELKELEDLAFGKIQLLRKYNLSKGLDFLKIMHPMHLKYISKPNTNSLDYFFSIMDDFDSKKRDEIIKDPTFFFGQSKGLLTSKEISDLISNTNYETLKEKCYALREHLSETFIVKSLVNSILEQAFLHADKTSLEFFLNKSKSAIKSLQEELKTAEEKENLLILIRFFELHVENLPKKNEHWFSLYTDFCNEILPKLMEESILDESSLLKFLQSLGPERNHKK